jgi:lipoyl(octanoyl) transferase
MPYAEAYAAQLAHLEELLSAREAGRPEPGRILFIEHDPPVITVSRRPTARQHLVATPEMLARAGVTVAETDRGGDITYHGPGQQVVYPILDLNFLGLRLHEYMRLLEQVVIDSLSHFGVHAERDCGATGVWVGRSAECRVDSAQCGEAAAPPAAKICAMGVRVKRWISLHGLALNVTTNLQHFQLIVPCGLAGRPVTSLAALLGEACPSMEEVRARLRIEFARRLLGERGEILTQSRGGAERDGACGMDSVE